MRMARKLREAMIIPLLIVILTVLVNISRALLNLPEMPGPPYPDRWGNNRWGVKYDPRVHGRGRPSHQSSFESSPGSRNHYQQQHHHPIEESSARYRGGSSSSSSSSSGGKWGPGLKPLVSKLKSYRDHYRKRQRSYSSPFDATSDSSYRDHYKSKSIDRYVKNYMRHYNSVAKTPPSSDLVNIQNFMRPVDLSRRFRTRNFDLIGGNRPTSDRRNSRSDSSSSSKPSYRTYNPQADFFGEQGSTRRSQRNFAKTLSNIYNDYQPGAENSNLGAGSSSSSVDESSVAASDAISNSIIVADDDLDPYTPYTPSTESRLPPPSRPRPSSAGRPTSSYSSGVIGPPPYYSKRPRRPSSSSGGSRRPLSALDLYEDTKTVGYSSEPGPSIDYSEPVSGLSGGRYSGPSGIRSGGISYSYGPGSDVSYSSGYSPGPPPSSYSSGPSISSYSSGSPMSSYSSGPPPSSYSSASSPPLHSHPGISPYDSFGLGQGPIMTPVVPMAVPSFYYPPPSHPPSRKSKRKKKRLQHTPMNVLRGLLGRDRERGRDRDRDRDHKRAYANLPHHFPTAMHGQPLAVVPMVAAPPPPPPPPQYSYSPLANSIASGIDYMRGSKPREPEYSRPSSPQPNPSMFAINIFRDKPQQYRPPPPPPRPRLPPASILDLLEHAAKKGEKHEKKECFSVGSGVDAVAGGINAVRKETSKMFGEAVAKGIMMGGTAVHEASKGMATVITKMAHI